MAAENTAYRVCQKVGLRNPCNPKKLITPETGKFVPEDLIPDKKMPDSDRKLLLNKAKKAVKSWLKEKFVEACFLEEPKIDLDEDSLETEEEPAGTLPTVKEEKPAVQIGKKVWTVPEEELAGIELEDLNMMIANIAEQNDVAVPQSHPYKSEKAAIKHLGKDL